MAALLNWLKRTATQLIDPDRERSIAALAKSIETTLSKYRQNFSVTSFVSGHEVDASDLREATELVYRTLLARAWKDSALSEKEQQTLGWASVALNISPQRASELNLALGSQEFERALIAAVEDGEINDAEANRLKGIAQSLNSDVGSMIRSYFSNEGARFLQALFGATVQSGWIDANGWNRLVDATAKLGLTRDEMLRAIAGQAQQFAEHVLADAKADATLSREERALLDWLRNNLIFTRDFRQYLDTEIGELDFLTSVMQGVLPTLAGPFAVETRAGEIVHWHSQAERTIVRNAKQGPRFVIDDGIVAITDNRMIFSGRTLAFATSHRSVVGVHWLHKGIELRAPGKGAGVYNFGKANRLAFAVYRTAIGRANQTIVSPTGGIDDRYIPREIRQRVWQRFGGRCAECGSEHYLEFDHVIPIAKGGANSEANIQLLCRGCNLKKSDNI